MTRRAALAGAASTVLGPRAYAAPTALPLSPTILIAGPPGSRVDQWAALIAEPLGKSLLQTEAVGRENVGGPDGVTGANHFQASTMPDGATAMIMPGATALSWLVGDTRVRFDAGTWAPLWGGAVSAIAFSRVPLVRGRRMRVAVPSLVGPTLAALLALDLMGIEVVPVSIGPTAPIPLDRADVDLVLLRGSSLKLAGPELAIRRWTPAFGLGTVGTDGRPTRDPAFMDIPTAHELIEHGWAERPPVDRGAVDRGAVDRGAVDRGAVDRGAAEQAKTLSAALRSVVAAATLDVALVLPLLSPAAVVAWWRQGCTVLANAPDVQEEAARSSTRQIEAGPMSASIACITAEPSILLELRRWLAERHQWRPG